jgi:predicted PurR-regulated permease PerM
MLAFRIAHRLAAARQRASSIEGLSKVASQDGVRLTGETGRPVVPAPVATASGRLERIRSVAAAKGVPLPTIVTSVALVTATYLAGKLVYRLKAVILSVLVAGFLALILNPIVRALQRWGLRRRGLAVAVVTFWAALVFVGLVAAFGFPLSNGLSHLSRDLPRYVDHAENDKGAVGQVIRDLHLQAWVARNAPKLQDVGAKLARPAVTVGRGAATVLARLTSIAALVVLLLLEGPKMRAGLLGSLPPAKAKRIAEVASEMNRSVLGYAFGNLLTSVIAGAVVFFTLLSLSVPFPLLWGLWVAMVDFLPQVGGMLAGVPTVLFATGQSLAAGIVTLVVFVVYQQVENHILTPVVMSRTVKVNPLLVLLSVLVAASIGQWLGGIFGAFVAALLAVPTAGALQVLLRELWRETAPGAFVGAANGSTQLSATDSPRDTG